jgi:hypothetical protein
MIIEVWPLSHERRIRDSVRSGPNRILAQYQRRGAAVLELVLTGRAPGRASKEFPRVGWTLVRSPAR